MSKEAQLSVAERDFILEALRDNVRLDGRGTDEFRPLNLSFGDEYGHVKLQVGKTRLVTISIAIMQVTRTNFLSQHCCPHLR
jgi:exosome complex component RRP45